MPVIPSTTWAEIEPGMKTGDLILFSGRSSESLWIEAATGGMFSHTTMIYRPDPSQPPLMWQEAPEPIVADPYMKTHDPAKTLHGGAQLGDALAATQMITYQYDDSPYYLELTGDLPSTLNDAMAEVVAQYEDRPFGTILEMVLQYMVARGLDKSSGDETLCCSALVGLTFMKLGLFKDTYPHSWYSPNSYAPPQSSELPWAVASSLTVPVPIEVPKPPVQPKLALAHGTRSNWPAGPTAPSELPPPPATPWHHG